MRWFKPNLRGSIHALFSSGPPSEPVASAPVISMEEIRDAMAALMKDIGENPFPNLARRIRYATDVHALWYLRGDLMAVLAGRYGEAAAREKIDGITDMFEELLPRGLRSRHSPLSSRPRE